MLTFLSLAISFYFPQELRSSSYISKGTNMLSSKVMLVCIVVLQNVAFLFPQDNWKQHLKYRSIPEAYMLVWTVAACFYRVYRVTLCSIFFSHTFVCIDSDTIYIFINGCLLLLHLSEMCRHQLESIWRQDLCPWGQSVNPWKGQECHPWAQLSAS